MYRGVVCFTSYSHSNVLIRVCVCETGYSVISAVDSFETLYISGAPRYNLTGGVFVFRAKSHELMSILQGDQVSQ